MSAIGISAEMYGNVISLRTVRRRLQEARLPVRIASRVRLLRQKKKTFRTRLPFARRHFNWSRANGETEE